MQQPHARWDRTAQQLRKQLENVYGKVCKDFSEDEGLIPVRGRLGGAATATAVALTPGARSDGVPGCRWYGARCRST